MAKAIKPPPQAATAEKPIVGPKADSNKPIVLVGEAIAWEICKSKNDPRITPKTVIPKTIVKGILILFINKTSNKNNIIFLLIRTLLFTILLLYNLLDYD